MNKEKIEFETTQLVLSTYNKIALWNNNDYDTPKQKGDALKLISQDIVQNALEVLMSGLQVKTTTGVTRGGVKVGDSILIKDTESFNVIDDKKVTDKLFD